MIYGFAYLGMVIAISAGWIVLAVLKKSPLSSLLDSLIEICLHAICGKDQSIIQIK